MARDAIAELNQIGQSIWYDSVSRAHLQSGEMQALIDIGISGVTSNPTIFEKAVTSTPVYDDDLRRWHDEGVSGDEALDRLIIADIQTVAGLLRPLYERTNGLDGYVSIEEDPRLAYDRDRSIADASRLHELVQRENVMIKIPSTAEGISATEEAIFAGINVNITLMFSLDSYEATALAYVRGLERRLEAGLPVDRIASVASFFVSRVDTLVDKLLEERIVASPDDGERLRGLQGKAAIANAKMAYQRYLGIFEGERFRRLREAGAMVQRVLWASTSTKNPNYLDVLYVDNLIGPNTINTLPPATVEAVRDHSVIRVTLTEGIDEAIATLEDLADAGIDMKAVTDQLQREGVDAFAKSWKGLQDAVASKMAAVTA